MTREKVLVTSSDTLESAVNILREHFDVKVCKYSGHAPSDRDALVKEINESIAGVTGILWSTSSPLTKELIEKAGRQLKVVAAMSAGYNHIAVDELKKRGIKLTNTSNVLNAAVAEVAVALILAVTRRFPENLERLRTGAWAFKLQENLGLDLRGSTVGIIGLGGIGQAIIKRLSGFEVGKFVYSGRSDKPEAKEYGAIRVSLENLLSESDFVVLACPLNDETKHLINEKTLKLMKSKAVLINIGRGGLVDQSALYSALVKKQIWGAGLDVTTPEPLPVDDPLLKLPNVFILPHIGSATEKTRRDMAELAAKDVVNGIKELPFLSEVKL